MKRFNAIWFIALLAFANLAAAKTIEMDVNGLVCAFCAQGIEKTLKKFPATSGVFVSLEHRLVAIELKDGEDVPDASLRKAITNAGYTVLAIRRTDASLASIRARTAKNKSPSKSAEKVEHVHDATHDHSGTKGTQGHTP